MIYFYCPECSEELEAEDSIRNQRMKCPACWKEIPVPEQGIEIPSSILRRSVARDREGGGSGAGRVVILAGAMAAVIAVGLFIVVLAKRAPKPPPPVAGTPCAECRSSGKQTCLSCQGVRHEPCVNAECKQGKITNFQGGEEPCLTCNGTTRIACRACAGTGTFSCPTCEGRGRIPDPGAVR